MTTLLAQVDLQETYFEYHEGAASVSDDPTSLITQILPNAYIFASIILLFFLVGGGLLMITSAGNPERSQTGQKAITSSLIGFLVIFASYWIIQIIQVLTGVPILSGFSSN